MEIRVGPWAAVLVMAGVTYLTRVAGALAMEVVPLSPAMQRFLGAISGAVLVALVVPELVQGDLAARAAVFAAVGVAVLSRSLIGAMLVGVAVAAVIRIVP